MRQLRRHTAGRTEFRQPGGVHAGRVVPRLRVSDTSQAVPASAPNGVTWTMWNGEALPSSTADGPGKVTGAVPTCYSHTPVGALIALAQFDLRTEVAHDPDLAAITTVDLSLIHI